MNKNEKYVITINRELGSGGRTIGRKLAEKLGVPFYDKWLINELKKKYNLDTEEIEKLKAGNGSWWRELLNTASLMGQGMSGFVSVQREPSEEMHIVTSDDMFYAETELLRSLAVEQSCVIAGRTGFAIFADHPNHLSVLVQASMSFRLERVMQKQKMTEEEARKTIEKVDKMRENYVSKYTKSSRYDTRNYDLVISADGKSEDEIVDIIMDFIG